MLATCRILYCYPEYHDECHYAASRSADCRGACFRAAFKNSVRSTCTLCYKTFKGYSNYELDLLFHSSPILL
jgi:hypothetical protein